MKITPTDYRELAAAVMPHDTPKLRGFYIRGEYPRAHLTKDVNKRYRWDLFSVSVIPTLLNRLYSYLDDTHIDTALRQIVPPLEQ